jgi:Protein of unknown function (DUF1592)/Protein of unknown function (DUF1595)/Protein of unknown function (DUF1588)
VRKFGARALRHPLSDADVAFYLGVAGATIEPEDYGDVIAVMLSSPGFLYLVEQGDPASTANPRPLTGFELAARLSYHFWQTMPDADLAAAAESGALLTDAGYKAQVERLASDARAEGAIDELYGEWLEPTHLDQLDVNKDDPAFKTFAKGFVPTAELRDHMTAELTSMARYYTQTNGSFEDFFRSDRSFAEHDDVASLYGVAAWHGGEPPAFADGREGVLARAALTATGFVTSRPIIKGVYVRRSILCDTIPDPPADAMSVAQMIDTAHLTTSREFAQAARVEVRPDDRRDPR